MNQSMNVDLYGAQISSVDGVKYASLYIGQQVVDEKEEGAKGIIIMKLPCDPDVYEKLSLPRYPAPVEIQVRLKKAAGGRLGQHCVGVIPRGVQSSSPVTGKAAPSAN